MTSSRPPATDQGAGAGEQLLEGERLAQVVVGAAVEAAHPVADRVARREEEHGRGPALAAMALQDRQAVRAGQPPVEDDEVPFAGPQRLAGRVAVGGVRDGEALVRQPVDDRSGEACVVLDQHRPAVPRSHARAPSPDRRRPSHRSTDASDYNTAGRSAGAESGRDEADFMCGYRRPGPDLHEFADGPGARATMKGILGFLTARAIRAGGARIVTDRGPLVRSRTEPGSPGIRDARTR